VIPLRKLRTDWVFIALLGMLPILWLRTDSIIAKGDYFPFWFNPSRTLNNDTYLWSTHNMGNVNAMGSFLLYEILWLSLRSIELSVGIVQILFQIFFFMGAGFSMYYLSKTAYPQLKISPLISSTFYMLNFFVLKSRLNPGMAWTYTFLPLLMALLIKIINITPQQNSKTTNKTIIYFAITSTIAFSFASVNPPNVIIALLLLATLLLYYLITQKNRIPQLLHKIIKVTAITTLLSTWWIIPILNYYLLSPSQLNPQISVTSWSWTHSRASFLNLFWLNGGWDWRPEYVPYIDSYSNPILIILTFVPFFLAATALLFKSDKSHFNTYIMLTILIFLFLAKGLHEPLSQLNLLLYTYIPSMNMFREPQSKFTMALMPFLALLIGYTADHIANIKIKPKLSPFTKTLTTTICITTFIITAYPLVTNPIETKTEQLPFSSYIKIPDYWNQATDWLNNQPDDYKILITPPDDFYAMPYTWGYYGTEEFLARFIQKPILLTYYSPYRLNPDTATTLEYLGKTITYNKTAEFKALLDLLNIKYILQRNDIQPNLTGRNIIPPEEMQAFFASQPYIRLAQKFEQLDIYEYTNPKPYIYTLDPTTLQKTTIKIEKNTILEQSWNFTNFTDIQEWQNTTLPNQFGANQTLTLDNGALKAELWNSTWGWKTINSPIQPAQYGNTYQIQLDIKGQNAYQVHVKTVELNENKEFLTGQYSAFVNDGTFNWTHVTFNYEPTNKTTKYIQIQIWHGHETPNPFPNTIWIDNIQIKGYTTTLNTTGLNQIFQNTTQNQPATILNYKRENPIKITATINATQPFTLAISEALDQSWTAYINGKQYKPTTLYLCINGFHINQTGLLDIIIEYEPQKWFHFGCAISLTTLIACTAYLTLTNPKTKKLHKKLKHLLDSK
jgi:hypothetical protein